MDPLSIIASVLTISTALGQTLQVVVYLRGGLAEVKALITEISDLTAILSDAEEVMRQQFGQAGAELPPPTTGLKSLCDALEATKQTAQLLDEFLHRRVMREDDLDKDPRIRKRTWLVVKPQLSTFKSQFYSHREHLCRALHVASLSISSRIELSVSSIVTLSEEAKLSMAEQGKQTQHLMEEVQNLRHLVLSSDRSGIRKEVVPASGTIARQATFPTNNPAPWGLEVRVQWQRPVTCSTTCRCACHHPSRGQGVRRLWPVLGVLFWGYAGLPVMRPGCDDRVCRRPVQGSVTMSYFFPPWLVKQAIALTLRVISSSSIELSLRATRIVDNGALVFKMTHLGDRDGLRALFDGGLASPLDCGHLDGWTALHFAVDKQDVDMVQFLIGYGADPSASALGVGSPASDAWEAILGKKGSPAVLDVYRSTFKESECIDDMELTVLHEVILEITPGRLSQVIEDNPSQLDLTDAAGNTALNWAALRGDLVSIELLLSCGSDPNVVNLRGESPLASASKFCRADCMKALLDAGADVRPDVDGLTPLHYVCGRTDRVELIQLLLRCDVNLDQQDIFCRSPLAMAVWKNHHRVAELLLSLGADKERKDVFGASPLLRAVQYNAVDAARVLIEYGANTSSTAKDGQTILHRAALSRSESMMKYLANVPFAPIDISVKDGMDMTAKERLMQLKPSMELLQAFTELSLAASRSAEASLLLAEDAPIATYSSISAFRQASDSLVALPFLGNMFTRASAVDESGDGSRLDLPRSDSPFESFEDAVEFQN